MTGIRSERRLFRALAFFISAGVIIFDGGLFLVLTLVGFAGVSFDSSVLRFYLLMAALGAVFGFERWWSNEVGSYNPVHDR